MTKRIADIVADILTEHGIHDVFSVVGGGAMFLNDALAHHEGLRVMYNHHEQASAIAAEGYYRASGKMAAVCVTTGPGGTNALTGVMGAYQDNIPMIVISGQVRYETTVDSTGLNLRMLGEQEFNIVDTVKTMTKYAVMVKKPENIRYELEKAIHIANEGRKGPCWVDIPLNIQGGYTDDASLKGYDAPEIRYQWDKEAFFEKLLSAKRPVILTGSAIRTTQSVDLLLKVMEQLKMPVAAATYNADLVAWDNPYYFGNFGVNGGRAGNFICQNADLIIGLGCRMAYRQIGFNYEAFAPEAQKIVVDVDEDELRKPTLQIDLPIHADIRDVLQEILKRPEVQFDDTCGWLPYCRKLKETFPVYQEKFGESSAVNPYFFVKELYKGYDKDQVTVLGNSSIAGHVLQMGITKQGQRVINNMNCGSMGYDLPAAIGAARSLGREVTLITGDGSFQMNLQELQTVVHYGLPIKIFLCNNGGYRAIVRTQRNFFEGRYTGCTAETGVSMPDMSRIAKAYGIPYFCMHNHGEAADVIKKVYDTEGFVICEVMQDYDQMIEPRIMSKKTDDGKLVSPPMDDLFPFLSKEEYADCVFCDRG